MKLELAKRPVGWEGNPEAYSSQKSTIDDFTDAELYFAKSDVWAYKTE